MSDQITHRDNSGPWRLRRLRYLAGERLPDPRDPVDRATYEAQILEREWVEAVARNEWISKLRGASE